MYALLLVFALAVPPQEAPPRLENAVLDSVEEVDGGYECQFSCPWPKGSSVRLEITRRATHMSWAPWIEKDATGREVELVNLSVQKRQRAVHRDVIKTDKDEAFTVKWKPKVPGVYHLQLVYDPGQQAVRDPRFRKETKSLHRLFALSAGQPHEILVEDAREALRFSAEYFKTLRSGINTSSTDVELEQLMRKLINEALRRGEFTQHPGTYSLMEHLSPYVLSVPKDPEKTGPNDPRRMSPNKIDIKTANFPPSIIRESLVLALMLMEDALEEAGHIAPLPKTKYTGDRRLAMIRIASEVLGALEALGKLEPVSKLGYILRVTAYDQLMKDASALILTMMDKREADPAAVKALVDKLKAAMVTVGHPRESMKQ